jgi:hypothetical protein
MDDAYVLEQAGRHMYCLQAYTEVRNEHIFYLYVLNLILHCDYNTANINLITKAVYTHTSLESKYISRHKKILSNLRMVVSHSKTGI